MSHLDLQHFEQLKSEIQSKYLENHTPSDENISNWKGIDIVYFQEDLRKVTKGNISEKSFYTYFKTSPLTKTPRIDILNILSSYVGYVSWYDFKKNHLFAGEILSEDESENIEINTLEIEKTSTPKESTEETETSESSLKNEEELTQPVENELVKEVKPTESSSTPKQRKSFKDYIWLWVSAFLLVVIGLLGFKNQIFETTYTYHFVDYDRNAPAQGDIEIKVIKENESPIFYRLKPGEPFYYPTDDKILKMEISSPFYENLEVVRNLEDAPKSENIQLKPDDYKIAFFNFSKKDISGNEEESLNLIRQKRKELENRISNTALIYQVFDNDIYGVETLDKQKYINLVTTPTTSLKNLSVIEMKREKGKIVAIKFKIKDDNE